MSQFPLVKLSELAEISGGITKNSKRTTLPIQRPYLAVANVYANRLDLEKVSTIGVNESELKRAELKDGDLIVVEGNGSLSQLGRVALWRGEIKGCLHQNHLIKVRPGEEVESKWILYWLMSPAGRRAIEAAGSSTSGLHTLSLSKVSSLPTPLAPKEDQYRAIAYIELHLSRLDETIATLQAIQAKLKQARASILKAAVGVSITGERIKTDIECKPYFVKDICLSKPSNGKSVPTGNGFPVLRLTAMKDGKIDAAETKLGAWIEESAKPYAVQPGDFFVMRGNGSLGRVGDAAIATDSGITAAFPDTMIRLQPNPQLCLPAYLLLCWRSPDMRSQIEQSAKTTAGIYKINQRDISGYRIALPAIESQRLILQEVERRFSVLDQVEATVNASLRRCGQLRQAVLKRAFSV